MSFCLAFFGDLNDWLHRNHHFSFEPSGISKTKFLFQVVNILQVADNVYLPMPDEQSAFLVKSCEDVNSTSDILKFLKSINLERIKDVAIEKVFSNLKGQNLPFYFTQPIKPEWKDSVEDLEFVNKIFEDGPADVSVVFVTKIRDLNGKKIESVATNGSQASSLLLFVHRKNQPESKKAESLNQTSLSSTGPSDSSNSSSIDKSNSSSVKLFQKIEGNDTEWAVVELADFQKCIRGAKSLLFQPLNSEEFQTSLSDWQLMLAHLLRRCNEEIERDEEIAEEIQFKDVMSKKCKNKTYRDHWELIKDNVKKYFNSNSETSKSSNPKRPVVLCPSKTSASTNTSDTFKSVVRKSGRAEKLLSPPRVKTNNLHGCYYCPRNFELTKLPLHLLNKHKRNVFKSLICPFCKCKCENKNYFEAHLEQEHGYPSEQTEEPKRPSQMHLCRDCQFSFPEDKFALHQLECHQDDVLKSLKCPFCKLYYKNPITLRVHLNQKHGYLMKTGLKKKPEESAPPDPQEPKRPSQMRLCRDCQLSFPEDKFPEHQYGCHQDDVLKSLKCPFCQRFYKNAHTLRVHIRQKHSTKNHDYSVATGLKRKPEDFASPESKRTSQLNSSSSHPLSFPSVSSSEVQLLDNFKNIENETASTSYGASMSYSDHLNSAHEHQEENSNVFLWPKSTDVVSSSAVENSDPFPNLSVVFSKDELDRLVPLHDDSNFNLLSQTYNALNEDEFY